ncbi:uncharacterized protein LOC130719186 [Lotus japonicus]|uniref:uncharacterized protein LOC130719186 n=1 Tax=Lotus japonicus TaxID=34305 RepID=UPI00258B9AE6|nr:uncharacterized protein LOC130719186 [Lotus japonicus]
MEKKQNMEEKENLNITLPQDLIAKILLRLQSKDDYLLVVIPFCRCEPQVIDNRYEGSVVSVQSGGPGVNSSWPRIEVLSLKTNVPSFYGVDIEYLDVVFESKYGLFLDKSLHWLVTPKDTQLRVIIAFDLVERSLSEIPLSHELAAELAIYKECYLRVLRGCLSLCYSSEGDDGHEVSVIWVMEDYKVQSSWTKSFVLSIQDDDMPFLPICFTKGGDFFGLDENGEFEKFNDKGELLENHTYGLSDKGALKYFDMYKESLLTLPSELS